MDDNLPVILEPEEELIDIEPADINLKGKKKNENVKWRGHPHIASRALTIIMGGTVVLFGFLSLPYGIFIAPSSMLIILSLLSVIIGLITLFSVYTHLKYTRYVITDSAIYRQTGWLRDRVKRVPVDGLQTIEYEQSIPERILNFGTVQVSTAGTDDIELQFKSVVTPKDVHKMINDLMEERVNQPKQYTNIDQKERVRKLEKQLENARKELSDE